MNTEQKADVKFLIEYYESRGWDWSEALEYQVRRSNGSLPWQERQAFLAKKKRVGRPRKQK